MAKHHHSYRRRRHNPFGLSQGVFKDSAIVAAGALASLYVDGFFNQSGWMDVLATGGSAIAVSFVGKSVSGEAVAEELLKGGITATIIKAIHQAGFLKNLGLGTYVPGWYAVPTASDQYLRTSAGNTRGIPPALPAGVSGGFNGGTRYKTRYASRYQ
jgi:hypothetical protein